MMMSLRPDTEERLQIGRDIVAPTEPREVAYRRRSETKSPGLQISITAAQQNADGGPDSTPDVLTVEGLILFGLSGPTG